MTSQPPSTKSTQEMFKVDKPKPIKTIADWRDYIIAHWAGLRKKVDDLKLKTEYERLIAIAFLPVLPRNKQQLTALCKLIEQVHHGETLNAPIQKLYANQTFTQTINDLIKVLKVSSLSQEALEALDSLLVRTGALAGVGKNNPEAHDLAKRILDDLRDEHRISSGIRVQAGMISADQNVIFATGDVNIVTQYYKGDKALLRNYLSGIRSDWNVTEVGKIVSETVARDNNRIRLHHVYAPIDVWSDTKKTKYEDMTVEQLTELRFRAIEQDVPDSRQPVLEAIAIHPLIVITGGPGTGKSALCRFLATCLAYACDPEAEKDDKVDGLKMLGSGWVHGALLPLYVNLRYFCADKKVFPNTPDKGKAQCLLNYLRSTTDSFASELERYLNNVDVPTHGTLLILDGLDEVYEENDRLILQRIIENWADRYPKCRILVTSRTYAYRQDALWRLTSRFAAAELAPYTWNQMQRYIDNWYDRAAILRPISFGGRDVAKKSSGKLAQELMDLILNTPSLIPLARQPLLLALLTIIHEQQRKLPETKAKLYQETVTGLNRWKSDDENDKLSEKLVNINLHLVSNALKLIAFDLQKQPGNVMRYPTSIKGEALAKSLKKQDNYDKGLGAKVEDIVEYLGTRNGILVSDQHDLYRFPHLSIQEYLAACALIDLYDECAMPEGMVADHKDGWTFPMNIAQLMKKDAYRWRNVTLFAGSIIASGHGQDARWVLIDELLPEQIKSDDDKGTLDEEIVHSIYIAAEVWAEIWLKARTGGQKSIQNHLIKCLQAIRNDARLDAPELANAKRILGQLEKA